MSKRERSESPPSSSAAKRARNAGSADETTPLLFSSKYKRNGLFLLSNFYGGAEIDYMLPKFTETKAVFNMVQSWKNIRTPAELNRLRHDLDKKIVRVHADGSRTLVPKGGKSGAPYTPAQERSYVAEYKGKTYLGTGILAKLVANSWKNPKRMRVMEFLADIPHGSMSPPINLYERSEEAGRNRRERSMRHALSRKFSEEPYRSYLLATGTATLGEASKDPAFGFKGQNLLGKWLMDLREELRQGGR